MTVFCYFGLFLCDAASIFTMQKYGKAARDRTGIFIYALVTGIIAMAVFWGTAGFSVTLNGRTALYSAIIAVLAICSYFTQLPVYRYLGVAEIAVITSGGRLILSSVAGVLLFSEALNAISALRIVLMLVAVLLLFVEKKKPAHDRTGEPAKKVSATGLLLCLFIILIGTVNTVVSKYIAVDAGVTDSNSLFFFANVLITGFSILFLLCESRGHVGRCITELCAVPPMQYLTILINTVASNISSLLGVLILAQGDITLYVPLSNALGLLATEAVAALAVHERPKILPVIFAMLSMLLGFFG
ncbi:MAG: hypothetical protein IJX80_10530 [Clostridia bacterium]|nr:hypothetical protein [Clostridia bacterium]